MIITILTYCYEDFRKKGGGRVRAVGIIAEYNPFHNGHAYQLAEARRRADADIAVAVMSGSFTQRGDAAILSVRDRVNMALSAGADAVFLLPALWAVLDAEHFALGGVSLLTRLGCDAISFGVETDDLALLQAVAALLEEEPEPLREAIRDLLAKGLPHPAARAGAVERLIPGASELLRLPNNTLAVCYLRAMRRIASQMEPVPILRTGAYHEPVLDPASPSATAIRLTLAAGDADAAMTALPERCRPILLDAIREGRIHRPDALDGALFYRLLTMRDKEWDALPGNTEGIANRLRDAFRHDASRKAILADAKTKRYPEARLSRMLTHALLQISQADLDAQPTPPGTLLLGLTKKGIPLLKRAQENSLPVYGKAADWIHLPDPWVRSELLADQLWWAGCRQPPANAMLQRRISESR